MVMTAGFAVGCGGGSQPPSTGPGSGATSSVTVTLSSTANDQVSGFNLTLDSVTLTNQSGKIVTLLSKPVSAEFIHLNGTVEPLVTASIPQDTYTSATVTVGESRFFCVTLDPATGNGIDVSNFAYGQTPSSQVSTTLPAPITVAGNAMELMLNMQVSPSATYNTCIQNSIEPYSINPTFSLASFDFPAQPTNSSNGEAIALEGFISSVDTASNAFTVAAADGPSWTVKTSATTLFQGVAGFHALAAGVPVDMDGAIQTDGSLLASRIAVYDKNTTALSIVTGPLLFVDTLVPELLTFGREQQGALYAASKFISPPSYNFGNATFPTSGQLANLRGLPFAPSFTAANMVAGQNVSITSHAAALLNSPNRIAAATVTLMPQTINGTIAAVSTSGGFDTYTVLLAPYDLIPALAVQPGQTTLLANPGTVVVYVDSNTQMLNSTVLQPGTVMRFYGLLFNDQGTLRMDCTQVNDGVAE
ncbi:MAG TPA: DUF5666 domain-containing protein [Acidobacteriaceae bacterium]|jgi:hypothetical protein|nr:DUF5666 domain-containing protein [Acidobacteriaceae bacterium]